MPRRAHPTNPVTEAALASLRRADYVDAVGVQLTDGTTAPRFVRSALAGTPSWVRRLPSLRDAIVRPFGLHTRRRWLPESSP
ncbi:MAG: DUF2867 domain-containing protein [Tepidiformaceae bacterium]